jgi:hypothetical protein
MIAIKIVMTWSSKTRQGVRGVIPYYPQSCFSTPMGHSAKYSTLEQYKHSDLKDQLHATQVCDPSRDRPCSEERIVLKGSSEPTTEIRIAPDLADLDFCGEHIRESKDEFGLPSRAISHA